MLKNRASLPVVLWPLFLAAGFGISVFFRGTDNILFAPALTGLLLFSFVTTVYPGFKPGVRGGWAVPWTGTVLCVVLYGLYMGISPLWSTVPYNSVLFALIINTLPFLFLTLVMAPDPEKQVKICTGAFAAVLIILACWALIQFFFFFDTYGPRIHHPMLNPNSIAALFSLGLLPALAFFIQAEKKRNIVIGFTAFILFYTALLVTQSRGAILADTVAALVVFFILRKGPVLYRLKIPAILTACFVLFLIVNYGSGLRLFNNVSGLLGIGETHSVTDRILLWHSTWNLIQDHFWSGTGLGTFYYYYPAYRFLGDQSDGYFTHMDPLQFWAETGIAAPVLFYSVLLAILIRTIKSLKSLPACSPVRAEIIGPFCALLAVTMHTHITFHLYILPVAFAMGFPLAFWYIATEKALGPQRRSISLPAKMPSLAGLAAVTTLFMLVGIWILQAAAATWCINEASAHFAKKEMDSGIRLVHTAQQWAPGSYARAYEYAGRLALHNLRINSATLTPAEKTKIYHETLRLFAESERRNPVFAPPKNYKALLLFQEYKDGIAPDGDEEAVHILKDILKLNPMYLEGRMGLARIYVTQGKPRQALNILEEGLIWPRPKSYQTVRYLMQTAQLRKDLGDGEGYTELFWQAKHVSGILKQMGIK